MLRVLCLTAAAVLICSAVPAAEPAAAVSPAPLIDRQELLAYLAGRADFVLIDARSTEEFEQGHILRAANVPHDRIDEFAGRLPQDPNTPIVVYCRSGKRAAALQGALLERGYANVRLLGPAQITWSSELPMFNCGVVEEPLESSFIQPASADGARPE